MAQSAEAQLMRDGVIRIQLHSSAVISLSTVEVPFEKHFMCAHGKVSLGKLRGELDRPLRRGS